MEALQWLWCGAVRRFIGRVIGVRKKVMRWLLNSAVMVTSLIEDRRLLVRIVYSVLRVSSSASWFRYSACTVLAVEIYAVVYAPFLFYALLTPFSTKHYWVRFRFVLFIVT